MYSLCIRVCMFTILLNFISVSSYNILCVVPHTGRSHFIFIENVMKGLAKKGHNVTVIGSFPLKEKFANYKDIVIPDLELVNRIKKTGASDAHDLRKVNPNSRFISYFGLPILHSLGYTSCVEMFESKNVQDFLKTDNHFDIVITELFITDCALAIAKKFNSSVIRYHPSTMMAWHGNRFGNPFNPAYMLNNLLPFFGKMTFLERLESTLLTALQNFFVHNVVIPSNNDLIGEHFGEKAKTLEEDIYRDSLMFLNTHHTMTPPTPLVPNIIEIGGVHIGNIKPLPVDLEKWINESQHGVIYFSLGSQVKVHTMPDEKRKAFINAFKRLPQRVIWKWENDTMEGKPDNVLIGKWMPQFDILSHPNVKAFISHGGLMGTIEAVHNGVPVIVMPLFGDQHVNGKSLESVGGGIVLYLHDVTEETLYQNLKKILEPSFQAQTKELSERFKDRPMPPLETAIYWVEYVARHKGAHFMKTAAVRMPFYQYYLLDVIAFIAVCLIVHFYILYIIFKLILRKIGILSTKQIKQKKS